MTKTLLADSNYVINSGVTIREVLEAITDNQRGAIVVVDDEMRLVGVISDGDLRRAFLRGATIQSRIEGFVNLRPFMLKEGKGSQAEGQKLFQEHHQLTLLPVVDESNYVVDVVVRDPKIRKIL